MQKVKVLNIFIDNLSTTELLQQLDEKGGIVFTPNVDHLMILQKDRDFYETYKFADYSVCDGQILMYCLQLLGTPVQEKISGSDLLPAFYEYHKDNQKIKIFLLGAAPGVAEKARENINLKVEREMVVGAHSPSFGFEKNAEECAAIVDLIEKSGANVLAVGVGAPKQEKWIVKHREKLKSIKIFLAIGATIDFEAGHKKRAPKWMSNAGLETPYRLFSEPRRLWKRYLINDPPFLALAFKQKINIYQNPFID
ncbi:MAG: WecB/TagA/CpsF family glycosyltransferase [Microcoleus sp. PH2017_22_RUC_O_B]|uniref:WecB/TagA/CpsF family glycosyltransferase n=1 Tax=unclassified Microcoleus TaxID=2642155 RepID=UPI001D365FCE|nr:MULTISPECIES: WecB/TagA/CpsF family glycosyltransferase [unclassified Microcoleus]MCC3526537.1 WecB/TagA/CpsF family glycosyltransferase [Microcoleus sp. PH2017_21_RUC_O_A]MCC3538835.1 WecB/TagA/CpsF family glycosyltransferase [Microcoleus sp. PH2017_22_RUC_O_B]